MPVHGAVLYVVAFAAALVTSAVASPAGVSGAVLLLPFQVSVLGTPSPSVTPTNLLYNVVATPGALLRYWRQGQTGGRLTAVLLGGTIPGVVAGSIIRVELVPGPEAFEELWAKRCLTAVKVGRHVRFAREDLDAFITTSRVEALR